MLKKLNLVPAIARKFVVSHILCQKVESSLKMRQFHDISEISDEVLEMTYADFALLQHDVRILVSWL